MKKTIAIILTVTLLVTLAGCSSNQTTPETKETATEAVETSAPTETTPAETKAEETTVAETEEVIEDDGWDELEALGNIQTENGILTATITIPKDLVGDDITQEKIDAKAGETYISGKLNDDGSVTYKMTKKQHKAMMDGVASSIDKTLNEMVDSADNSFTEIKHNKSYTEFDVTISGEELSLTDSFSTLAFYMYGGMYGVFTGHQADNVVVNFYNSNGDLINTANSDNMGK